MLPPGCLAWCCTSAPQSREPGTGHCGEQACSRSITFQPPWCWATSGVGLGLNAVAVLHSLHHCQCVCWGLPLGVCVSFYVCVSVSGCACLFTSSCLGGLSATRSWGTVRINSLLSLGLLPGSWVEMYIVLENLAYNLPGGI